MTDKQTFKQKWGDDFFASRGFIQFPAAILEYLGSWLRANDIRIILALLYFKYDQRNPYPSVATLAAMLGITPRAVQKTLHSLQEGGWIKIYAAHDPSGRQIANEIDFRPLRDQVNKMRRQGPPDWALGRIAYQRPLPYDEY